MLSPDQKGAVAELAITHHAARLGIGVLRPLTDGLRYDLVFDLGDRLLRVQCKWAARRGDVLVVPCRSCRRSAQGFSRRPYSAEEVDLLAAYSLELDRSYLISPCVFSGRPSIQLRLPPARNNQRRGINWAEDFDFAATIRSWGHSSVGRASAWHAEGHGFEPRWLHLTRYCANRRRHAVDGEDPAAVMHADFLDE